jgi:hypothetical protein
MVRPWARSTTGQQPGLSMFTKQFDRKVHRALAAFGLSALFGVGYGYYVLWPSNMEAGFQPAQPVAYSHKLHAGDMKIECLYCHAQAEEQALATIPPLSTCMKCHGEVQSKDKAGRGGGVQVAAGRGVAVRRPRPVSRRDAFRLHGRLAQQP